MHRGLKRRVVWCAVLLAAWTAAWGGDIDRLLDDFSTKNALSRQTIDENKGHLILFTREQLERMRVHSLKDVFKTTPVIYYHENRYALPDPLAGASYNPYLSSFIRIYIDGVEITQGWMGSGLLLYGDMNIDFVDHIEFYYAIPSFENSVEPAYMTIFLYSKEATRDTGGKVMLSQGSRGYNEQTASYIDCVDGVSYMVNLTRTDAKREKINEPWMSKPLSRDFERLQLVSYVKTDRQVFHLNVLSKKSDAFAGASLDATPVTSYQDYLNIHADYGANMGEHWNLKLAYDRFYVEGVQSDEYLSFFDAIFDGTYYTADFESLMSTYSAELTYRDVLGNHHLAAGVKGRLKTLDYIRLVGADDISLPFDSEGVYSVFFQDQYMISQRHLLTFGVEGMHVARNGSDIDDNDLLQLRIGYIYNGKKWRYKAYIYRMMFTPDAYLYYFGEYGFPRSAFSEPQSTKGITQEITYERTKDSYRLILFYMKDDDGLLRGEEQDDTTYFFSVFDYTYRFDYTDMLKLQLYYARYSDIFNLPLLEDWSGYAHYSGSVDRFDYYAGVVWHRNSLDYKDYFDLSLAVTWNLSDDLAVAIKGDNLLDKAKETGVLRIDPETHRMLSPLYASPIDRRVSVEVEYTF